MLRARKNRLLIVRLQQLFLCAAELKLFWVSDADHDLQSLSVRYSRLHGKTLYSLGFVFHEFLKHAIAFIVSIGLARTRGQKKMREKRANSDHLLKIGGDFSVVTLRDLKIQHQADPFPVAISEEHSGRISGQLPQITSESKVKSLVCILATFKV